MNAESIVVGNEYRVKAIGTTAKEWWKVIEKRLTKRDEWEIICTNPASAHSRIFKPESFKDMKTDTKMITRSVELEAEVEGIQIWREEIIQMPDHKRRGRPSKIGANA